MISKEQARQRLNSFLKRQGMTVYQLAQLTEIPKETLRRWTVVGPPHAKALVMILKQATEEIDNG